MVEVAEKVAELGGESLAEVARRTGENFRRLFRPVGKARVPSAGA